MILLKCEMCNGEMQVDENLEFGICDFCGSRVMLPRVSTEAVPRNEAVEHKSNLFKLILVNTGPEKIKVIKVLRDLSGAGLAEAKDASERTPTLILENVPDQELVELCKMQLEEAGATAQIVGQHEIFHVNYVLPYNPSAKPSQSLNTAQKSGCYVATAVYGSYDCPEVWILRRYRDTVLAETWCGRSFIRLYYAISPTVVRLLGETKWFNIIFKRRLDSMTENLRQKGVLDTPYSDK
ncbi:MAG: ribosomal protein L7/L12 [Oscillospiraceae bacterium]|nr:ribosomal protein L7/L12 [Oscillospiraceae bacterium]